GCPHGVVATNHVHHVTRALKPVEDVLRCLKHACAIDDAGDRLFPNDERFLKPSRGRGSLLERLRAHPELVHASDVVAERCQFLLRDLQAPLPCFPAVESLSLTSDVLAGARSLGARVATKSVPSEKALSADQALTKLAWEGASIRYTSMTARQRTQIQHELDVVEKLQFAGYFLILWDIVRAAKQMHILVQGRGSAANSAVCYCLGITAVDPIGRDLLFERFLSEGRSEPPDIDLDIEHNQRERLLQYVYERYGRDHAAMVAAVHTFQPKQASKDVARVLGFSADQGEALAALCDRFIGMDGWGGDHRIVERDKIRNTAERLKDSAALRAVGLDTNDRRVRLVPWLVEKMVGLPRHRSIHTGGFVLSERPIHEVCPIEWASMPGRSIVQWEKDDLSTLGIVKFDLLGLGMLTVIADHLDLIEQHRGLPLDLWQIPADDEATYDDICAADTVGVFQIESRAQMNTLPRLKPRQFYDLVVEVALIRPGPIQGEMVHPYLRRRSGLEPVTYLHPSLEPHLARTLGVPLFQEQGMKVAIEVGGFSPVEADALRRAMGHKRSRNAMLAQAEILSQRMIARGIEPQVAARIVKQLAAFADYGFPESHAASFALLVYASAYLRHHYMPEFYAAILNAQPMGFYSPASLVEDARRHGVLVLPPDMCHSDWDCTLEDSTLHTAHLPPALRAPRPRLPGPRMPGEAIVSDHPFALRIGLRYVRGLGDAIRPRIEAIIAPRPRTLVEALQRAVEQQIDRPVLLGMAAAGVFGSLMSDRRRAIWEVLRLGRVSAGPLDLPGVEREEPELPEMTAAERVGTDYLRIGLSTTDHPMKLLRAALDARGVLTSRAVVRAKRINVRVAGIVTCRQRPPTAKGFAFLTLEDEHGMLNVVVEPQLFEAQRAVIVGNAALEIDGLLEREEGAVNVKAKVLRGLALPWREEVMPDGHDFH
ncbi:MAG: error-prone DNA polymerase, partial [Polyangiales bacterium]